jgi:hypothetical protein
VKVEWREVGEDVTGAQKDVAESSGSGVLGRAEELDRKSAPGWMRKGIRPPIKSLLHLLTPLKPELTPCPPLKPS